MNYELLKTIHIFIGAIVFGSGLSMLVYEQWFNQKHAINAQLKTSQRLLRLNLCVIMPAGLILLLTGIGMIHIKHLDMRLFWIQGSTIGFMIATITYLISLYYYRLSLYPQSDRPKGTTTIKRIQQKHRFFAWMTLIIIMAMIFLMVNGPSGV